MERAFTQEEFRSMVYMVIYSLRSSPLCGDVFIPFISVCFRGHLVGLLFMTTLKRNDGGWR
jgi:hypothetical protein